MRNDEADAQTIRDAEWRQGSILPPDFVRNVIKDGSCPELAKFEHAADKDWWLVVSQDCDVVQRDFVKEPFVELIRVEVAETHDGADHWGKNPRRYQFDDSAAGAKQLFQVSVHDRVRIDRRHLADVGPDGECRLEVENIQRICRWISQRYVRPAFPDAFNERAEAAIRKLRKKLKKQGKLVTSILIKVEDAELEAEDYHPTIWATMKVDDYDVPDLRAEAQKLLNQVEAALGQCDGIEIESAKLQSEQEVCLDHLREFKRWDFDDLTLRGQSVDDLLPDE